MQKRVDQFIAPRTRLAAKATRKKRRKRLRWFWDVEANDPTRRWDRATLICAEREDGEQIHFAGPSCMAQWVAFVEKNPEIYYAHFGGGYDVPLMLNYWRPEKIVITGSIILVADGGGASMRDTYPYWLASAAKIGDAIGLPKIDIDRAQTERLSFAELLEYCRRDVKIPKEGMRVCRSFLEGYGIDPDKVNTAGTAATSLLGAIEPLSKQALTDCKIQTQMIGEMLDDGGVVGGMTNTYWQGHVRGVHCYDIKSSYPARYATRDVPIGLRRAEASELARPETFRGVARASFCWPWRRRVPVAFDALTGAGYGDITAMICDDEIQILLREGIKVKLTSGWCGVDYLPIGQDFARELFAAKESKGPDSFFSKVFVNAWHGKTGMHPVHDNYEARYPRKYWTPGGDPHLVPPDNGWLWHFKTLGCDKDGFAKWHSQPMISAITLGRARAALWEINNAFQKAGWQIYMNDTDSVLTDCPPEKSPVTLGKDLGMLAYEGGPYDAIFLGAKAYILIDADGRVAKCALKGIPHKSYRDGMWDDGMVREARGDERLRGSGVYTRKGVGRDQRIELFERALVTPTKAQKEGLTTFKRGLRAMDWRRDVLTREVRPTVTNVAFDAQGWRLLDASEIHSL